MSIIGKLYIPIDNSYSICISKDNGMHGIKDWTHDYLAGTSDPECQAKICTVVSEPFLMKPQERTSSDEKIPFVLVEWNNNIYSVMYLEDGLNNIEQRILDIDKHYHLNGRTDSSPIFKEVLNHLNK